MKKMAYATAALALTAGCNGGSAAKPPTTTLHVYAAASLKESFTAIAQAFERSHPGVRVDINFAGSPTLAQQIVAGAPADLFAAASSATMKTVTDAGLGEDAPVVFARNRLELAVTNGNTSIHSLDDAVKAGVKLALCAPQVPCGAAAVKLLAAEHLTAHPVTEEQDVKSVLSKVTLGEADAGLVYVTDIKAAKGKVTGIELPDVPAAIATYPLTALKSSKHTDLVQQLITAITDADGQSVLHEAGFLPPA